MVRRNFFTFDAGKLMAAFLKVQNYLDKSIADGGLALTR